MTPYGIYTIKPSDTIQKIAMKHGLGEDWTILITINNLEYPYIVPVDFPREGTARGEVRLTSHSQSPLTIPEGTVLVATTTSGQSLQYTTMADITIPPQASATVSIQAESFGSVYNLPAGTPLTFRDPSLAILVTVETPHPLTGGFYRRVKKYGEVLYIPMAEHPPRTIDLVRAYGVDIATDENREITIGTNQDVTLVVGVENLSQALRRAILTEKGSYFLHPWYGSNLHQYLGEPISDDLLKIIEVELRETILRDVRVQAVERITMAVHGDAITVNCLIRTTMDLAFPLQLVIG